MKASPISSTPWRKRRYALAAELLRRSGYDITYKANDRSTFRQRGIVRRLYDAKAGFLAHTDFGKQGLHGKSREIEEGKEYIFKIQKLTRKQKKQVKDSGLFSKEQFTKHGVFIEKPVNIPAKDYRIKFTKKGIEVRMGKRRDLIVKLDWRDMISDAKETIRRLVEKYKPKSSSLVVNGFRATSNISISAEALEFYITEDLLPSWFARNGKYYEGDAEAMEEFTDIFHLRLIY